MSEWLPPKLDSPFRCDVQSSVQYKLYRDGVFYNQNCLQFMPAADMWTRNIGRKIYLLTGRNLEQDRANKRWGGFWREENITATFRLQIHSDIQQILQFISMRDGKSNTAYKCVPGAIPDFLSSIIISYNPAKLGLQAWCRHEGSNVNVCLTGMARLGLIDRQTSNPIKQEGPGWLPPDVKGLL